VQDIANTPDPFRANGTKRYLDRSMLQADTAGRPGNPISRPNLRLLAGVLVGGVLMTACMAQPKENLSGSTAPASARTSPQYHPGTVASSAKYYQSVWGIDNLLVRQTASGSLVRFSYRVTDPERARVLSDDHATPYLYGQRSHALLQIPVMEKVGPLRQSRQSKAGREYWMTFANNGHLVKAGDRVDVIIGPFHAIGLMVE
jgi:hypothetical protein